jgi:hypothetical protein
LIHRPPPSQTPLTEKNTQKICDKKDVTLEVEAEYFFFHFNSKSSNLSLNKQSKIIRNECDNPRCTLPHNFAS